MNKPRKLLRAKIHSPMVIIGFGSLITFALVTYVIVKSQVESSIQKQAQTLHAIFTSSIQDDILNGLDTEVYRKCSTVLSNSLVSEILVEGLDERILCREKKPDTISAFFVNESILFSRSERTVAGKVSIGFQNRILGNILFRIVFVLTLLLFILGCSYWFLSRFVLNEEIKKIEELSRMLIRSNPVELENCRLILGDKDSLEISHLCDGIEQLSENWRSYRRELSKNQKLQGINRSSRLLAHDIKSPIGAVKVGLSFLHEKPEQGRILAEKGVKRIEKLLNDIIERDETYSLAGKMEQVEVEEFYRSLVDELLAQFDQKRGIKITFLSDLEKELISIFDRDEIFRCVVNLVKNAVEAITFAGEISVSFFREGARLGILVKDNGPGIPESIRQQLGSNQISSTKEFGNGLGLMQVYDAIDRHGGDLKIDSSSEGSEIKLIFGQIL